MGSLQVDWFKLFQGVIDALVSKFLASQLTVWASIGLLVGAYVLSRPIWRRWQSHKQVRRALDSVRRETIEGIEHEGPGFWLREPRQRPQNYSDLKGNSIPILMIAATKGGVGKTSLAGSLAAHFAMRWTQERESPGSRKPVRVLVIDQDFQGSFSTMTVEPNRRYAPISKSNRLASGELDGGKLVAVAEQVSQTGMTSPLSIWTIPAYYDLAQAETRLMVSWLFPNSDEQLLSKLFRLLLRRQPPNALQAADIRYHLAKALLDPNVQQRYDIVIIDSPPRLTTSHIQGMCAATHCLIPTVLDGLSADAVTRYLDQLATHKLGPHGMPSLAICPHLQAIGVVGMMLPNNAQRLDGRINELSARIAAARLQTRIVAEDCMIRIRPPYREHAGERIAYAADSKDKAHEELRAEVDRLGACVAQELGVTAKGWRPR